MKSYSAGQQITLFRRQRDHASLFRTMANLTAQHAISNHRQQIHMTLTVLNVPHPTSMQVHMPALYVTHR
jgi:hypothetical protein